MATNQLELIVNQVKLLPLNDLVLLIKRAVEVLEQKQKAVGASPNNKEIDLKTLGIDTAQAAELRAGFATFEDWDVPEMDIYNDYEASKSVLDANA